MVSLYVILGARYYDSLPAPKSFNFLRTGIICLLCITFSLQGAFAYVKNNNSAANMTTILKSSAETNYTDQGIIGNFDKSAL